MQCCDIATGSLWRGRLSIERGFVHFILFFNSMEVSRFHENDSMCSLYEFYGANIS